MIAFEQYQNYLRKMSERLLNGDHKDHYVNEIEAALNGQPNWVLRTIIEPEAQKQAGAYFTGTALSKQLLLPWRATIKSGQIKLLDPTCGVGDLLLAAARDLPIRKSLQETVNYWGNCLFGYDIHETFIKTAKVRLLLLAIQRCGNNRKTLNINNLFPGITCGDFMRNINLNGITHIAMNPPFTLMRAPVDCAWGHGLINAAGLFLEKVLSNLTLNARIAAILPDVLRTGTRYNLWRNKILTYSLVEKINIAGHFGSADVDIFMVYLTRKSLVNRKSFKWWNTKASKTIGDRFNVNVGPVVPHRDPIKGTHAPFYDTGSVLPWSIIRRAKKWRKFDGRLFQPPFILLRRTSSPSDKLRAIASLVISRRPSAIENHLLVVSPKDGKVSTCLDLLERLKLPDVSVWLNKRIRCRHLTVDSVLRIPINRGGIK